MEEILISVLIVVCAILGALVFVLFCVAEENRYLVDVCFKDQKKFRIKCDFGIDLGDASKDKKVAEDVMFREVANELSKYSLDEFLADVDAVEAHLNEIISHSIPTYYVNPKFGFTIDEARVSLHAASDNDEEVAVSGRGVRAAAVVSAMNTSITCSAMRTIR